LVHLAQRSAQGNTYQEILRQYEPSVEEGGAPSAGTPHLADDLPAGVTDTTVACPGRSSLSLFVPQRKGAPKLPNMTKQIRHSYLHHLFRFLEWCEGFLIPIFCSYV
jgi:hypothetical protein